MISTILARTCSLKLDNEKIEGKGKEDSSAAKVEFEGSQAMKLFFKDPASKKSCKQYFIVGSAEFYNTVIGNSRNEELGLILIA